MRSPGLFVRCLGVSCLTLSAGAYAQDIWVDASATGVNDGSSWNDAYTDLQDALDAINVSLGIDEIWVAAGTYKPSVQVDLNGSGGSDARRRTFELPVGLTLLGGFDGTETAASQADPAANVTILSGDLGTTGVTSDNAYHVLVIRHSDSDSAISTTVSGFTITGGNANESDDNAIGGGAWLQENNGSGGAGGGGAVFRRCIFEDNFADAGGGAVSGYRIGATFRDCVFRDNQVNGDEFGTSVLPGGGAVNIFLGKIIVANCRFESNVSLNGPAGALHHYSATVAGSVLANCEFRANTAATDGGAVVLLDDQAAYLAHVTNCVFAGNVAEDGDGGGMFAESVLLHHSTFAHNDAPQGAGGGCRIATGSSSISLVENCIFWKNADDGSSGHGAQLSSQLLVCPKNSIIEDFACGTCSNCGSLNNVDADPEFYDIDGADDIEATVLDNLYHLRAESPAVDTGDNALIPADLGDVDNDTNFSEDVPLDLSGLDRVLFTTVDRGSYEFTCLGDIVNTDTLLPPPDGIVDGADLAVLIGDWSLYSPPCGSDCISDIVDSITLLPPPDGVVDGADLAVLLGNWGNPCNREDEEESLLGPTNPFAETELGDLLDQLMHSDDEEEAAALIAQLLELLSE